MEAFSQGYKFYGLQFQADNSVIVREWAPGAKDVYITGDFSKYLINMYIKFSQLVAGEIGLEKLFRDLMMLECLRNCFFNRESGSNGNSGTLLGARASDLF